MNSFSREVRKPALATSWLALNLLLLVLVAILSLTYPVEELSRRLGDAFFRLRGHQPTSSAVAMVVIDDDSLERYGRWPWPRAQLARLINAVSRERPASIGVDILLSESEGITDDNNLAQAIGDAGNVVLAAKLSSAPDRLWTDPLPLFRARAAGVGHVQAMMDPDGIGRRVPLLEVSADGPRWPLAVEIARVATGQPIRLDERVLRLGNKRIWFEGQPRHRQGTGWSSYSPQFLSIDFRQQFVAGEADPPFLTISAASILEGQTPSSFRGKNVLIGFGASDLGDRIPTPVSGQMPMPGVELHANLLDGVLAGHGIRHAGLIQQVLLLLVYSLVSTWLVLRRPGWESVWIPLVLLAASYGAGFLLFNRSGILLDFGPLVCAAILAVPLTQLEDLVIVNRALNRGLQQLRSTLLSGSTGERLAGFQSDQGAQDSARDLPQKLDLTNKLQLELASLYTFRQNLLESMQEGLAVFDTSGKMEFRNPFWEKFCLKQGWKPAVGLVEFGQLLGHPRWTNLGRQMSDGSLPSESEVYLGGGFWQVRGLRLATEGSSGPCWMVVVSDLTSRLERDQARAEALRFVTHELRTPLVSIQGFAEFLLRYPKAEGAKEAAATVFRESQRLVSLINTYLDVLRFDAGARSLRKDPVAIPQMVAQVEKIMAPIADSAEICIRVELDSSLPVLLGDPPMLTGVLLNLLNNAVKYSPEGSEIAVRIHGDKSSVIFDVSNPGSPIAPEHLSRFFEPFYRAHEHETATPGWGLGLTFVKRIVEEHQGTIEATSDEQGIRVRVRIPTGEADVSPNTGLEDGSH
jgi:signal transduction histidine kinase/CHASE2 domain-containing sensor protein